MNLIRKNIRDEFPDYSEGDYFVTICTRNKEHYFGKNIRPPNTVQLIENQQIGRDVRTVRPESSCLESESGDHSEMVHEAGGNRTHGFAGNRTHEPGGNRTHEFASNRTHEPYVPTQLTDYQGDVTGVIDSNAKIVQETGYYPYGEPWLEPDGDNPYLYGGKERMALGGVRYSDFGPRLLSTASGYWGSPDPLCEDYYNLSPYINCAANPVRFSDPTGLSPVYSQYGDSLGCTKEGFTGQILIYMGDENIDFSKYSVSELMNSFSDYMTDFDEARDYKFLKDGAHSRIITSVLSHFEGLDVLGHKFSLSELDGGRIWYAPEKKDSNWDTSFSLSDAVKPRISYTGGKDYEATVENFASSAIIHEWYSHGVQHVDDRFNNHSKAYFNVIYKNALWEKTTQDYKNFYKSQFIYFLRNDVEFYQR